MDWNKKIYPSDILRFICEPFKPLMDHIRSKFDSFLRGWRNAFDIKWKGDHEDKFVDTSMRRPIKPPPSPVLPKKHSKYYRDSMDVLDRAEKRMNEGMKELDKKIEDAFKRLDKLL